jgi:chromosome segregation ATPase
MIKPQEQTLETLATHLNIVLATIKTNREALSTIDDFAKTTRDKLQNHQNWAKFKAMELDELGGEVSKLNQQQGKSDEYTPLLAQTLQNLTEASLKHASNSKQLTKMAVELQEDVAALDHAHIEQARISHNNYANHKKTHRQLRHSIDREDAKLQTQLDRMGHRINDLVQDIAELQLKLK